MSLERQGGSHPLGHDHDPYWTDDGALFTGTFRFYGARAVPVHARIHSAEERYRASSHPEVVPLAHRQGTRTYLMLQPYALEPDIRLSVDLYPRLQADGAIGTVSASEQIGTRPRQFGMAQAWHYPADRLLVLWECYLFEQFRSPSLIRDDNMRQLWSGVEHVLLERFPETDHIATPFADPEFETDEYQAFLASLGYAPVAQAALGKEVPLR